MEYRESKSSLKVAIVIDWLTNFAGAERVVSNLLKIFPEATIFTSQNKFSKEELRLYFNYNKDVETTFLNSFPFKYFKHQMLMPLRLAAFESLNLDDYDLVISSASAEAKGVLVPTKSMHIAYVHTPTRYLWVDPDFYIRNNGFGVFSTMAKFVFKLLFNKLRKDDLMASTRADLIMSNSNEVKNRVSKYYSRDSVVLYPPVSNLFFETEIKDDDKSCRKYITVARLVPYKRVDIIIKACIELKRELLIIGKGSEEKSLKKLVASLNGSNLIKFDSNLSDQQLAFEYSNSRALIFAAYEDFGLTPVECMATGTPVIAYNRGGLSETVIDNKSGIKYEEQNTESLKKAILKFESLKFNPRVVRSSVEQFSFNNFKNNLEAIITKLNQEKLSDKD